MGRISTTTLDASQAGLPGIGSPPITLDHHVARLLSAQLAFDARVAFAQSFAATVACRYLTRLGLQPRPLPSGVATAPLDTVAASAAQQLSEGVGTVSLPRSIGLLGSVYTSALPDECRAERGIFYTPPGLVQRLLDMASAAGTDWRRARVLDPACGGGLFMIAAAARMMAPLAGVEPALILKQLERRLRGFELDPFGAWLAQAALDIQLAPLACAAGRPVPVLIETRDSLDLRPGEEGSFDLVVGNPPYGRVTLPSARRAVFARSVYGHANLYGLFTDAALRWAAGKGLVAYVTPTSMLSGLYHKVLRALLVREGPPVSVDLITERAGVFEDVLQETMLAVYRRGGRRGSARVGFLSVGVGGQLACCPAGSFTLPRDPQAPWLLPRAPGQVPLTRRLRAMRHRLADYGYGVSTGPLVWNRFKPQLHLTRGKRAYPVIWAEAVTTDGRFLWRTERRNHAPWFSADLPRDTWLLVDRPCVLLQRTTAKEQPRRLIAAEMPASFVAKHGAAVVENHLNMVRPIVPNPPLPSTVIAALLNSAAADAAFRCMSGSVAVSAFELEALPVPPPDVMRRVAELAATGAPRAMIERPISEAYHGTEMAHGSSETDAAASA